MGLASKMALAYAVNQGASVASQYVANKPSPYPQGGAPPQQAGQAAGYYQQGAPPPQQHAQGGYQQQGYSPGYVQQPQQQQQHAYGAPAPLPLPGSASGPGSSSAMTNPQMILDVLRRGVQDQNFQAFYPPGSLEQLAQQIAHSGALARIAAEWRLPAEIAMDLARLALVDVQCMLDNSGSLAFEENGERIDDAKMIMSRVAQAAGLFDSDGMQICVMNGNTVGQGIKNEAQAAQLMSTVTFSGLTPLGTSFEQKVLHPLVAAARSNTLRKPVLAIVVTDGEPAGEHRYKIVQAITDAKRALTSTRYGADALSIELAQVGSDQKAAAFLNEIDVHPEIGSFVDVTGNFEMESAQMQQTTGIALSPDLWVIKLMLGALDTAYDSHDERRH
ncbi:hypothetical protein JCM9279_001961 [Rhodotorula babjevae]